MKSHKAIIRGNELLDEICKIADTQAVKYDGVTTRVSYPYQLGYLMGLWSSMMTDEQVAELEAWLEKLKAEVAEKEAQKEAA